jgi:hypothetical protein
MPDPISATLLAGGSIISGFMAKEGANDAADAAVAAGQTQADAADRGVEEVRRQFDAIQELMKPYVDAGTGGLTGMQDLIGLNGADAQRTAISAIEAGPEFSALLGQGQEGILANASATGGLRGGNTQGALAQFRPALLSQLLNERFSKLGGITQLGQASAAGQASAGIQTGQQVSDLFQQQGAALAGGILGAGNASAQYKIGIGNQIGNTLGTLGTLKLLNKF